MARLTDPDRPLLVELDFTARTYDVDFMGIVSNIVYVRWLEDLRLRLLAVHHPLEDQLEAGYAPILARTEIAYKHPVRLGEASACFAPRWITAQHSTGRTASFDRLAPMADGRVSPTGGSGGCCQLQVVA